MSLDNFGVKSTRKKTEPKKKKNTTPVKKSKKESIASNTPSPKVANMRKKYFLKCSTKCGYKRTLKKRSLSDNDYTCRKCGASMKLYKEE
ncbi:hypothetical protein [Candidatus Lokiarchaeum ossiferum]|uniref:hypothetical protein n=1 Tax=Candidatus Lokiarchaeum ossiferum TaxID=2951803 RepID=UPI00352C7ED5